MGTAAYNFGQQATTLNDGNNRWNNLGAYQNNTAEAACDNENKNQTFDTLNTQNFAGNGIIFESNVPPLVTGIQFEVERRRGTGRGDQVIDQNIQIRLNGNVVGDNRASGVNWPTTLQSVSYGGQNDVWGLNAAQLSTIFNSSGQYGRTLNTQFGLNIRPQGRNTGFIRRVRLTLFYQINGVKSRVSAVWVDGRISSRNNNQWQVGTNRLRLGGRWVIVQD